MKLFTVGDSISQGFMSLAAARTDLSYSTLIARAMGLKLGEWYSYPEWAAGGLPLNLEVIVRLLTRRYGSDLSIFEALGVLQRLSEICLKAYDRLIGLEPSEVAVDGCLTKAPCGGQKAGRNSVDRG
jgi:hypothetical protein